MNPILSIFIPTYNRKERLIAQLQSLYVQSRISEVPVVISDNASDYSIEDEVLPLFKDKMDLRLYRFGTNTTGIVNIASVYLYSQTEWVWMLGDDDRTASDSIATILKDVETAPDGVSLIKYSLDGELFPAHEDENVYSFSEFIDQYRRLLKASPERRVEIAGSCAFMSAYVLRPRVIENYLYTSFFYGYNHLALFAPSLFAFKDGVGIKFSSSRIVKYIQPEEGKHWPIEKFFLGLCSWRDMPIKADERDKKWFVAFMANMFKPKTVLNMLIADRTLTRGYKAYVFSKILRESYHYALPTRLKFMARFWRKELLAC